MKAVLVSLVTVCALMPLTLPAQRQDSSMVRVGMRVRVVATDTILREPYAIPKNARRVSGVVQAIEADTLRLSVSPADSSLAVARILIYSIERSLGRTRGGSAVDAGTAGSGVGAVSMGFFREELRIPIWAGATVLGGIIGALFPYERWGYAWIPEG